MAKVFDTTRLNWNCYFSLSAASELVASLHVMVDPDHHISSCSWAKDKFKKLSEPLKESISFFGERYAQWLYISDIVDELMYSSNSKEVSFDDTMKAIHDMDDLEFAYLFLGLSTIGVSREQLLNWMDKPSELAKYEQFDKDFPIHRSDATYFIKHIDEIKTKLEWTLQKYWSEMFSKEWKAIEAYERSMMRHERLILNRSNPLDYIKTVSPDLKIDGRKMIFHKEPEFSIDLTSVNTLVVVFSVFAEPHFFGNIIDDRVFITLNLNFNSVKLNEPIPKTMLSLMNAVSDSTRLKIVRILWNEESTTKELAEILNLSPSTVSIHLKVLKEAELLESRKVKKYVYYKIIKEPFFSIQQELVDYLEY